MDKMINDHMEAKVKTFFERHWIGIAIWSVVGVQMVALVLLLK